MDVYLFQLFTEGYCRYEGDLLENLEDVSNLKICQLACVLKSECQYFVYDKSIPSCQLRAAPERTCDLLRGPPTPPYGDLNCEGNNPTVPSVDIDFY